MMKQFSLALTLLLLTACERVVDLNIPQGPRLLVVEARLERVLGAVSGNQRIRLSTTGSYFNQSAPAGATGAVVRVTDSQGNSTTFAESAERGTYLTSTLTVAANRIYTLSIDWEGNRYEATDTARAVAPIDSFYFSPVKPGRFSGDKGVRATIDFVDRPGELNFYLWDQYVNGVRQLGPDSTTRLRIIASDDGYDGLPINGLQPFEGIDVPAGANVLVRQIALSEDMYRYFFALTDVVSSDGSPFSVPPSSVRGNVSNRTNASLPAVGYFFAAEISEARGRYVP